MKPSVQHSVSSLRYIPIIAFFAMFFHVAMLICGINCPVCEIVVILMGFYIAYIFSFALGFCRVHRMCIYYALIVMTCIWMRRYPDGEYGLFTDEWIDEARWIIFAIGVPIAILLIKKEVNDHDKRCKKDHGIKNRQHSKKSSA